MSDDELQRTAAFYGISMDEARRRHRVLMVHHDDPNDPICVGCARRPPEIDGYVVVCMEDEDSPRPDDATVRRYVINNEGTYNWRNGHYLCDACYIRNGMPSSERGWVCP